MVSSAHHDVAPFFGQNQGLLRHRQAFCNSSRRRRRLSVRYKNPTIAWSRWDRPDPLYLKFSNMDAGEIRAVVPPWDCNWLAECGHPALLSPDRCFPWFPPLFAGGVHVAGEPLYGHTYSSFLLNQSDIVRKSVVIDPKVCLLPRKFIDFGTYHAHR